MLLAFTAPIGADASHLFVIIHKKEDENYESKSKEKNVKNNASELAKPLYIRVRAEMAIFGNKC